MKSRPVAWVRLSRMGTLALGLLALWPAACRKKPQVSLEVDVPSALADQTTWIEVGVFGGTSCNTLLPMLPGGIPVEGATGRLAWERDKPAPTLGDLPKSRYAFAAVGKDANCGVIAAGCTDVDVNVETSVAISLQPVNGGAAPCPAGARCLEARCIPGSDNSLPPRAPASAAGACPVRLLAPARPPRSRCQGGLLPGPSPALRPAPRHVRVAREPPRPVPVTRRGESTGTRSPTPSCAGTCG